MAPPLKRLRQQAGSGSSDSEGDNDSGGMGSSGLSEVGDDKTEYESDSGSEELEAEEDDGIGEEEEDDEYEQEEEDVMQEDELYRDVDMDDDEEILQSSPVTLPSRANKITLRKTSAPTHSTTAQSSTQQPQQQEQQQPKEVTAAASSTVPSPSFKLKLKLADRKQLPSSPLSASASQQNSKVQQAYRTSKQISRLKKEASVADSDTASSDRDFDDGMLPSARSAGEDEDKEEEEEEEEDSLTSESSDEPVDFSRLTNRQRAKYDETVGTESDLLSLPNEIQRKTKYTEAEEQLKKSESARRRKNQSEQKLEEQKIETINKLLKRQAKSTRRGARPSGVDTPASDDETASQAPVIAPADLRPKLPPNMSRWVNSASGSVLAIPESWDGIEIVGVNV